MTDLTRLETSQPVQLVDANDLQVCDLTTIAPSGTESGLVVRNIPSGTQVVSGTVTAVSSGTYTVKHLNSASANLSNVTVTETQSVQLLASNTNRLLATFFNSGENSVYIKWGTEASSTSHTIELFKDGFYEMHVPVYTGSIEARSSVGNNIIRVMEI